MMGLDERFVCLLFGMLIGFVLGWIVRSLREIKKELHEVEDIMKKDHQRNESGFMRFPIVADFMLLVVLGIVVYAAFASQKASNDIASTQENLKSTQNKLERVTYCNQVYLGALLSAVDDRVKPAQMAINANVDLQKAWYEFVKFQLHLPPYPEAEQRDKANKYADYLKEFLDLSEESQQTVAQNPYPKKEDLSACVNEENQDE